MPKIILLLSIVFLSGCSGPLALVGQIYGGADTASTIVSGKGVVDNMVSDAKNMDCRIHRVFKDEPIFDGQFSNSCYVDRMQEAFTHFQQQKKTDFLNDWNHLIFHLPYAFHGRRMIFNNWINWIKDDPKFKDLINEVGPEVNEDFNKKAYKSSLYKEFIENKISPGEKASSSIGNMYSASVFMSLLSMLNYHFDMNNKLAGDKVGFISYGSGSKAKVFEGKIENRWKNKIKSSKLFEALSNRKEVDVDLYEDLHKNIIVDPICNLNNIIKLSSIQDGEFTRGLRKYKLS